MPDWIRSGDKKKRRGLAPTHAMYLDPSLVSSYSRSSQRDLKARRRMAPTHPLYLDPNQRASYRKESSFNAFMNQKDQGFALRRSLPSGHHDYLDPAKRSSYATDRHYDAFKERRNEARERVFRNRQDSFVNSNRLALNPHYHSELEAPHWYPGKKNEARVAYLNEDERQSTRSQIAHGYTHDSTVQGLRGRYDIDSENDGIIFTRRGSVPDLMLLEKDSARSRHDNILDKINHSSFNQGKNVANAGFIQFGDHGAVESIELSSGHYMPDEDSGVALAMWAKKHNHFDPAQVPIIQPATRYRDAKRVDVSRPRQVSAVNRFAGGWQSRPLLPDQ